MSIQEKIFLGVSLGVLLVIVGDAVLAMPLRTWAWMACHHEMGQDVCSWTTSGAVRGICNAGLFIIGNIIVCNSESLKKRRVYS